MGNIKGIVLFFLASLVGCVSSENIEHKPVESRLYGTWECQASDKKDGTNVEMDAEVSYVRNGKANVIGEMTINASELPELTYAFSATSEWQYKDGYLIETIEDYNIVNVSHPGLDKVADLQSFVPKNISDSSKILVLNESNLKLKSESAGMVTNCTKL
ncbi:hypothetical protein [uncultured Halovibrio sp.]|uniref:hypothetical protein n=1 Tax=uncultured Halovibrio sp. TaxID=985049 RepID=UPI0025F8BB90|nr:hypothetical protein [uncultured Halovibrio sp.]